MCLLILLFVLPPFVAKRGGGVLLGTPSARNILASGPLAYTPILTDTSSLSLPRPAASLPRGRGSRRGSGRVSSCQGTAFRGTALYDCNGRSAAAAFQRCRHIPLQRPTGDANGLVGRESVAQCTPNQPRTGYSSGGSTPGQNAHQAEQKVVPRAAAKASTAPGRSMGWRHAADSRRQRRSHRRRRPLQRCNKPSPRPLPRLRLRRCRRRYRPLTAGGLWGVTSRRPATQFRMARPEPRGRATRAAGSRRRANSEPWTALKELGHLGRIWATRSRTNITAFGSVVRGKPPKASQFLSHGRVDS